MNRRSGRRPEGLWPLAASYGAFGFFWGCWVVVFADFLDGHRLSPGQGSLRFVALSVAAIVAMTLLAPRLQPLAHGPIIFWSLALHGVGALLIAWVPTVWLLAAFGLTGIGTGLIDVYVNSAGQAIEARGTTSVLQPVHAAYGVGGALGAVVAAAILAAGASFVAVLVIAAAIQIGAAVVPLTAPALRFAAASAERSSTLSLAAFAHRPHLLVPAAVVMAAFFIEGSMDVWSVIYLRRALGASQVGASWGFVAFALAVAAGRLFASRILFGMGYRRTIVWSGFGSALAGALAVSTTQPRIAGAAFLLLGFCLSAAAPAAFGLAGDAGSDAGLAIAALTTVGYTGFVVGPPVLGWLADRAGLRATMAALVVTTIVIVLGGLFARADAPLSASSAALGSERLKT